MNSAKHNVCLHEQQGCRLERGGGLQRRIKDFFLLCPLWPFQRAWIWTCGDRRLLYCGILQFSVMDLGVKLSTDTYVMSVMGKRIGNKKGLPLGNRMLILSCSNVKETLVLDPVWKGKKPSLCSAPQVPPFLEFKTILPLSPR